VKLCEVSRSSAADIDSVDVPGWYRLSQALKDQVKIVGSSNEQVALDFPKVTFP
jgi:hypothetical protein